MIFISYRKADTQAVVDHLADRLKSVLGATAVFKDDHDLHGGDRWPDRLRKEVQACDALLAVVGTGWLTASDEDGRRRLDDPDDWVRQEICTALDHGKRVIVLLVDAAKMPTKRGLPSFQGAIGLGRYGWFGGVDRSILLLEAEQVAQVANNPRRQGDCIKKRGDLATERGNHPEARQCYEAALALYQQVNDVLGVAHCTRKLGKAAIHYSDHAEAQRCFEAALSIYRQAGDIRCEADCIKGLGRVASLRSDHDEARRCYQLALPLYHKAASVLGVANCSRDIGDLAIDCSTLVEARQFHEAALALYREIGALYGEARCILGLGTIARLEGHQTEARQIYEQALALCQRIKSPYLIGCTQRCLARLTDADDRQGHLAAARTAWMSIDRPDLVEELDQEFGRPSTTTDLPTSDLPGNPSP